MKRVIGIVNGKAPPAPPSGRLCCPAPDKRHYHKSAGNSSSGYREYRLVIRRMIPSAVTVADKPSIVQVRAIYASLKFTVVVP
ncbi:hypothetical protein KCP73_19755 [Salmonella enterica subsp. enterica]|nr:hypothetical protein KCP73_19755 [Salmonella enterica subsp. enterica]